MNPGGISYRRPASDHCKGALVGVLEGSEFRLTFHFSRDCLGRILSLLHGDLRQSRQGFSLGIDRAGKIPDDIDISIVRNRQVRFYLDPSSCISLSIRATSENLSQRRGRIATCPDYCSGCYVIQVLPAFYRYPFLIYVPYHGAAPYSHAEPGKRPGRL